MGQWKAKGLRAPILAARVLQAVSRRLLRWTQRQADLETAAALTAWAYDHSETYKQSAHQTVGWFDFEARAVREWFPRPPAHVLVAGCGAGRELIALRQAGFQATGSDPAALLVQAARNQLGAEVPLSVLSLQDLAANDVLPGPFDAVIVGWGAWGHVLDRAQRENALVALHKRCPQGPVLLSWAVDASPGLRGGAQTVGAVLAGPRPDWQTQVHVNTQGVFHVRLGRADIEREAAVAGYRVVHCAGTESGYPHAVLQPV